MHLVIMRHIMIERKRKVQCTLKIWLRCDMYDMLLHLRRMR